MRRLGAGRCGHLVGTRDLVVAASDMLDAPRLTRTCRSSEPSVCRSQALSVNGPRKADLVLHFRGAGRMARTSAALGYTRCAHPRREMDTDRAAAKGHLELVQYIDVTW